MSAATLAGCFRELELVAPGWRFAEPSLWDRFERQSSREALDDRLETRQ
jgi:hypothetical protein